MDQKCKNGEMPKRIYLGYTRKEADREISLIRSGKSVLLCEDWIGADGQPRHISDEEWIEIIERNVIDEKQYIK